ncbi:hypothetical protein ZWY2020_032680 [Hordeum vulgare]|uniref:Predicted protein n=1 Tax=Hordeum vulgare subsp. vulgare TaxID=112509 RepID=F2E316_HORVV|nr:hypothetical protein ZWY2020_032680 [Hordeum vulgare]BAK01738.1 predicted protein [Hordeum vulgare subsp. vulgare]
MRTEMVIRMQASSDKGQRSKAMKIAAAIDGVESVTLAGEGRSLLRVVGEGVDSNHLTSRLRRKVGHADIVELRTLQGGHGYASATNAAAGGGYHHSAQAAGAGARGDAAAYGGYNSYTTASYSPVAADQYNRQQQLSYEYYPPPPYASTVVNHGYTTGDPTGCSIM